MQAPSSRSDCLQRLALMVLVATAGCAASGPRQLASVPRATPASVATSTTTDPDSREDSRDDSRDVALASYRTDEVQPQVGDATPDAAASEPPAESLSPQSIEVVPAPAPDPAQPPIDLADVVGSIHSTFPLLQAAYQQRQIAAGNQVAAWGAFDTKFKAATENGPLGFYETYRNNAGLARPIYEGGEVFGGYRVGRGDFQPWYRERQTNDGGEFKAGLRVPLLRNREIDARRAELWRATYDRERAEPEIRTQLILFVRDGSILYWQWVAAGRRYEIGKRALMLAKQRNAQLERKVELGDIAPPVLQDNLRAIAQREAKLIDLRRKLQQAAVKLSLFYRTSDGMPLVPEQAQLSSFPEPVEITERRLENDVAMALQYRPELAALNALADRINVDLAEARNDQLPSVDAQVMGSQDVGAASSSKRDKSEFELEAGVFVEVPLQRRKARGKSQVAQGKLVQIAAKRRFTEDKIRAEIQSAHVAVAAAMERLGKARESKRLAEYMATVERRRFDLGQSNLLSVVIREQNAIEAAEAEVDALLEYFSAKADYDAAMARDWPTGQ